MQRLVSRIIVYKFYDCFKCSKNNQQLFLIELVKRVSSSIFVCWYVNVLWIALCVKFVSDVISVQFTVDANGALFLIKTL